MFSHRADSNSNTRMPVNGSSPTTDASWGFLDFAAAASRRLASSVESRRSQALLSGLLSQPPPYPRKAVRSSRGNRQLAEDRLYRTHVPFGFSDEPHSSLIPRCRVVGNHRADFVVLVTLHARWHAQNRL